MAMANQPFTDYSAQAIPRLVQLEYLVGGRTAKRSTTAAANCWARSPVHGWTVSRLVQMISRDKEKAAQRISTLGPKPGEERKVFWIVGQKGGTPFSGISRFPQMRWLR